MVKSRPPPENFGNLWRDGRAAEGACLENMFGSHQRGFESHSLRHTIDELRLQIYDYNRKSNWGGARVVEWGRLLSGFRGEILGRRFESCPPRHKEHALAGVFDFSAGNRLPSLLRQLGKLGVSADERSHIRTHRYHPQGFSPCILQSDLGQPASHTLPAQVRVYTDMSHHNRVSILQIIEFRELSVNPSLESMLG